VKPTLEVNQSSTNIPVEFHCPNRVSCILDSLAAAFDIICPISAQILGELDNVVDIKTQLYCHSKLNFDPEGNSRRNGRRSEKSMRLWFLNVIIFGREDIGEKLGQHLSKRKRFLQDPLGCQRSIPYRNPHAMTAESDEIVMSDSFDSALGNLEIERLEAGPDLLAQLMKDDVPLPETEAPSIITTSLFRYGHFRHKYFSS
jgi:SWI/SNF-related matrix-associated actin-dependent regulator of chromatin subfamily A3